MMASKAFLWKMVTVDVILSAVLMVAVLARSDDPIQLLQWVISAVVMSVALLGLAGCLVGCWQPYLKRAAAGAPQRNNGAMP